MRRLRIAVCGTFDLENYGDLLFPVVFEAAMRAKGVAIEMVELAPTATKPRTTEPGRAVAPLVEIEAIHADRPFDAVVVGGGALIQWRHIEQALDGNESVEDYLIHDTWVVPALFCSKHDVPLLWNAPDVPYSFPSDLADLARQLVAVASYLSVRNSSSRLNLEEIGVDPQSIHQTWDTALTLRRYFYQDLPVDQLGVPSKPYLVVHINRFLSEEDTEELGRIIAAYSIDHDLIPVLLPLSNTHLDATALRALGDAIGDGACLIEAETIGQMAAVIGGASLYVGVSYHGAVTALAMGVDAIAYNYMHFGKTTDLFADLGAQSRYAETVEDLRTLLLDGGLEGTTQPSLDEAIDSVEEHFAHIAGELARIAQDTSISRSRPNRPIELDRSLVASIFRHSEQIIDVRQWIEGIDDHNLWDELAVNNRFEVLSERVHAIESEVGMTGWQRLRRRLKLNV